MWYGRAQHAPQILSSVQRIAIESRGVGLQLRFGAVAQGVPVHVKVLLTLMLRPMTLLLLLKFRRVELGDEFFGQAFADRDEVAAEEIMKSHIIDLHSGLDLTEREPQDRSLTDLMSGGAPFAG